MNKKKIAIIGSGAWGTAISVVLADNDYDIHIYGTNENQITEINNFHKNTCFFDDSIVLPSSITANGNLEETIKDAFLVVIAVPSKAIDDVFQKLTPLLTNDMYIVNLTKGFHPQTKIPVGKYIKTLLSFEQSKKVASLSGPSFALEVIQRKPTAITVSCEEYKTAKFIQNVFSNHYFKVFINNDSIGTDYASALKNIIAIACGISDGLGYQSNTKAMLITRGLNEISRFITFFGGNEKTSYGLAGIGDLILTCTSSTSRNYTAGYIIGKNSMEYFLQNNQNTIEGLYACEIAYEIAKNNNINAPIITSIYHILKENLDPRIVINNVINDISEED